MAAQITLKKKENYMPKTFENVLFFYTFLKLFI